MNLSGTPLHGSNSFYQSHNDRDRVLSPSKMRISQLSERLSNMQLDNDQEKQIKREVYEGKIKGLEEKVNNNNQTDEAKFKLLKEQTLKIQDQINTERIARESFVEKKDKELKVVENRFLTELQKENQSRKESENRILKHVDEKIYQAKVELGRDKRTREEFEERANQEFSDEILNIQDEINEEKNIREDANEKLIKRLGEEILKFQEVLSQEKKAREEAQQSMFRMLDEMNSRMNSDIQSEFQTRERFEEVVLKLLEQTCAKLENSRN